MYFEHLYMCFVHLEKVFDVALLNTMKWALKMGSVQEVIVKVVISVYEGLTTKIKVDSGLLDKFPVKVGVPRRPGFSDITIVVRGH